MSRSCRSLLELLLMQQQLVEAHAAAASTTGGWTIVWRPRGVEGVLEALTSLVESWWTSAARGSKLNR